MDQNLQAVLLFHNQQATNPSQAFSGAAAAAVFLATGGRAVPAREEPQPAPAPAPEKEGSDAPEQN